MPVRGDVSRVLMNFDGSRLRVDARARARPRVPQHRARRRTPLQRQPPMALAETATIFCETCSSRPGCEPPPTTRSALALLDTDLVGATQVVVDIHSRFLFETELFDRRRGAPRCRSHELNERCSTRRRDLRRRLDPDPPPVHVGGQAALLLDRVLQLAVHVRAAVRHRPVRPLHATDPERFRPGYDDLLSATGMADAAALAGRFGIDVRDEEFWADSLDVVRGRIERFITLALA